MREPFLAPGRFRRLSAPMRRHRWECVCVAAAGLLASGCERDQVQVYEVAKERTVPAAASPSPAAEPAPEAAKVPWTVPKGWSEKPTAGGMRLASYAVTVPDGRTVDISVVALGEQAGTELDNVNRWRRELELPPLEEAQVAGVRSPVTIGRSPAFLYDQTSATSVIDGKFKKRTLAAILPAGGMTVFFKAMGEAGLVEQEKGRYLEWLASVKAGPEPADSGGSPPASAGAASATEPRPAPASTSPGPASASAAAAAADGLPAWKAPAHWKPGGPRPMRLASFEVPGNGEPGDVSVSTLSGTGGGLLSNVNRWRGQVGLGPLDEAGLGKESSTVELAGGRKATLVDLGGGGPKRIVGAIVPDGGKTWFLKLTAPDDLARKEKDAFVAWVKSIQW